jgi:hypothetical protein
MLTMSSLRFDTDDILGLDVQPIATVSTSHDIERLRDTMSGVHPAIRAKSGIVTWLNDHWIWVLCIIVVMIISCVIYFVYFRTKKKSDVSKRMTKPDKHTSQQSVKPPQSLTTEQLQSLMDAVRDEPSSPTDDKHVTFADDVPGGDVLPESSTEDVVMVDDSPDVTLTQHEKLRDRMTISDLHQTLKDMKSKTK